jgi:hypothetical protein
VAGLAHTARVSSVDLIPAPAADAVTFRLHPLRAFLWRALIFVPLFLVSGVFLMIAAVWGYPPDTSDVMHLLAYPMVLLVVLLVQSVRGDRRNPGWVRVSAAGVEFAVTGQVPAFLPWPAVQAVSSRLRGPFTQLIVWPTRPDAVTVNPAGSPAPQLHQRFGTPAFVIDVGMMTPQPSVLLAELNRRLPSRG